MNPLDLIYLSKGNKENVKFWDRLGGEPSFLGMKVLDLGCGHGSLCIDIAKKGAKQVVGIDLDQNRINFATENLQTNHSDLQTVIIFKTININDLDIYNFDIIVSKDCFEHILDLDNVFNECKRRLKYNGQIYIGFSPLYNAPFGGHGRMKMPFPWGHLIFSERFLISRLNRKGNKISSISELGLNKKSLKEYKHLFFNSSLEVIDFRINKGDNLLLPLFRLISLVPFLKEYFTQNLYVILRKVK